MEAQLASRGGVPYSPTSPASDVPDGPDEPELDLGGELEALPAALPGSAVCESKTGIGTGALQSPLLVDDRLDPKQLGAGRKKEEALAGRLQIDSTEVAEGATEDVLMGWPGARTSERAAPAAKVSARVSRICPELVSGSRLDKSVPLQHNHWIKIGRNPKAHLLLNNAGVSRNQCSVRWDHYQRKTELRVESSAGTLVNGRPVKNQRLQLDHADRIRVVGKGQTFDFVLDLRPVGLGITDPRTSAREAKAKTLPTQRRDNLRAQLQHLDRAIKNSEELAFKKEHEYLEIATRRQLRVAEEAERQAQYKYYVEGAKQLEVHLEESRKEWLRRLEAEYRLNEEQCQPIIEEASDLQDKVEKLQLKKDELARSIHPEQYAVADVAISIEGTPQKGDDTMSQGRRSLRDRDDADGEEDAFADLSGLEDKREGGVEKEVGPELAHGGVTRGLKREASEALSDSAKQLKFDMAR